MMSLGDNMKTIIGFGVMILMLFILGATMYLRVTDVPVSHHHFSPYHGLFMGVVWIVIIGGVLVAYRSLKPSNAETDALETLRTQYALGNIDTETYKEKKGILERD